MSEEFSNLTKNEARELNDSLPVFRRLAVFGGKSFAKLVDDLITLAGGSLATGSVGTAELADGVLSADAAGLAKMADGFLSADAAGRAKVADGFVTAAKLGSGAVTAAKALVFVSTEQTGNGSEQSVAHGLAAAPSKVLIVPTEVPDAAAETGFDIAEGTHTSTNVLVTVTSTVKYKVLAWA